MHITPVFSSLIVELPEFFVAPGWYPDPTNPLQERFWDGSDWVDEKELACVAILSKDKALRETALARITDEKRLAIIAINSDDATLRETALARITDASLLSEVASEGAATFTNRTTEDGLGDNNMDGVYADGSTVYVATSYGLSISIDGGATFTNRKISTRFPRPNEF